jgi:hypothetical protein
MGGSLRDQLLKAGLVDPRKARQAEAEKRKQGRQQRSGTPEAERVAAQQALAEKAARDRELNRRRQEEARRKALAAEVADLIRSHVIARDGGDVRYSFADGQVLKQIYVTRAQQHQLATGQIGIVRHGEGYALVAAAVAEKVRARDQASLVLLNATDAGEDADDPYAAYKVPDDLMW